MFAKLKHHTTRILLSLVLTLIAVGFVAQEDSRLLTQLNNFSYDARLRLTMPGGVDPRIVIVDIDEKSLAEEGRWPWPRNRLADLVTRLFDHYGVAIVGFDVVFAEPDESSGLKILEELAADPLKDDPAFHAALDQVRPGLERDRLFAEAIAGKPVVLGYYFQTNIPAEQGSETGMLPMPLLDVKEEGLDTLPLVEAQGFGGNLPEFQLSAYGGGYFDNPMVDADGVFRRVPLMVKYQGYAYESLALAVTRAILEAPLRPRLDRSGEHTGLQAIELGGLEIPVDDLAAALVPYRGTQGSFPYVSAVDILTGKADPAVLNGTIVLVGTTAPGLQDLRSTPVQNVYAGVEVHANLIAGILDQTIKVRPSYVLGIKITLLLAIGLLLSVALALLSALWAVVAATTIATLLTAGNLWAWNSGLVLPIASPLLLILTLLLFHMGYGYFFEARNKRQITRMFGQYVPPELVDELAARPDDLGVGGETREMTVLFSDVRGFTTISEGLNARELTQLMNEMLTPMTHIIHQHRGTIDKYMGDAIMAFWGAPLVDPEHARNALKAGLAMVAEIPRLQEAFKAKGWPPIKIGVGLNTGLMNVGNMGSEFRMAYTVLGDAVNLGSRLEGLTKQYGISIMVSEFTKAQVPDFAFRELDRVRVKGKDEPVAIFEPIGPAEEMDATTAERLERYGKALACYREQAWDDAEALLKGLHEEEPERALYGVYLERIDLYREAPPGKQWDGVFTFTTK